MASFGGPIARDSTGTVRRREVTLSTREKQLYGQLWAAADKDSSGFITGADAVPFFAKSGLSPQILGQIWVLADSDNKGVLGQQGFSIAVKLIAHAQNGKTPSPALVNTDAPLPHFEGITPAKTGDSPATGLITAPVAAQITGTEPSLTNEDRAKYAGMFMGCGPIGGLLDGDKAREVFLRSKLPVDKLSQIWSLADTKSRGSLDIGDFTIAMYYIQHTMDGSIKTLPTTLSPSILKACTGVSTGVGSISSPVLSAQTLSRQVTGNNMAIHNPAIARQMTGSVSLTSSPLAKQNTGGANNLFGGSSSTDVPWDITPEEKVKFDRFFDQLDKSGTGVVGGEEAGKFFLNSRLPESVLAQIWDLADITGSGSLSKDEFAVAMLLINRKNATGAPIPKTLPQSLVPPSLRNRIPSSLSFPSQEPLRNMTLPSNSSSQQFRRQSFDLLGDGPMLTTSISGTSVPQMDKDLIGAEDLTSKITSETGELASMQNQINNLSKVTGDLQAKRAVLENNLSALSAQKQDISIRLNQIKTLHESESKSIKDLENALTSIQPQVMKLRDELSASERELATARADKDEYLLSLAKDQEENNQIRTRLRQNNEEVAKLRKDLEAKKAETSRQKGLLQIARSQLATSEADKQKLTNDIAHESEQAAQVAKDIQSLALEATPASFTSPALSLPSAIPPPPAPRGSRKEPPPPPASRGTAAPTASCVSAEEEEAFGIPEALRSPTGSFHSIPSSRMGAPVTISRQSTGSSPFEAIPRQGTGSSPFETISRQGTGSSPFEPIALQGTGMSTKASSISNVGENELWSPMTHAGQAKTVGQPEVTMSPDPETPQFPQQDSMLALAARQALPMSPPISQDPFGSISFPAMDTPPVTKMDFDSAFQDFATSKPSQSGGMDGVKSAEAFAEAFPDIGADGDKSRRVSAFGFEDDFSGPSPFNQSLEKSKGDYEFPPIVEMSHPDDDSSDDESNDDIADTFEQTKSSIVSPEPLPIPTPIEATASAAALESKKEPSAPIVAPVSTGSPSTRTKKLKAADFSEFESSFRGSSDDLDSAFKGIELAAPKVSSGAVGNMAGFDDGFDFNASFDDAFGSSSPPGSNSQAPVVKTTSSTLPASGAFGTIDLDEAFGGFTASNSAPAPAAGGTGSSAFEHKFDDFEAEFSPSNSRPTSSAVTAAAVTTPVALAVPSHRPAPATPKPISSAIDILATSAPVPPQVPMAGVDELINMGFTRQQAEDALLRYDNVERAANFLLEGGQ
ncbi:hypothetical protein BC939DRAFT_459603 [Gamsiella multidivaricata]|uniref:uncharacterized protein n=1 Tax=Gamsiella multidivaricata TaxID=101098 RepID=UPI00221F566F|nr:uncharacterized protein BC939DRAFT_459603 [Gamsiella multidivaricata]KAI7819729.1 hypothetical protein BC939DRAFT_459603 [Gamsiella multidivaricata]